LPLDRIWLLIHILEHTSHLGEGKNYWC
jgi:hypothetical protein